MKQKMYFIRQKTKQENVLFWNPGIATLLNYSFTLNFKHFR